MRYHIDTIPVWDALLRGSECPLCDLRVAAEQAYLESFLGASVMEPAMRIEVNAKGFCRRHFTQMLGMKNRLGLALMTHTHLLETMARPEPSNPEKSARRKKKQAEAAAEDTCVLCDRLNDTMDRYLYTVLHLYARDADFRKALAASKGFCLPHSHRLTQMARSGLSTADARAFLEMLTPLQRENMERIERELRWFTQKFDYRNAGEPWGNAKDAPERAISKLRGE